MSFLKGSSQGSPLPSKKHPYLLSWHLRIWPQHTFSTFSAFLCSIKVFTQANGFSQSPKLSSCISECQFWRSRWCHHSPYPSPQWFLSPLNFYSLYWLYSETLMPSVLSVQTQSKGPPALTNSLNVWELKHGKIPVNGLIAIWRHDSGFYKYVWIWEADLVNTQVSEDVSNRILEARIKLIKKKRSRHLL